MSETKKDKQLFTVARVFFLLIVIPLSLMAILIANGIFKLGDTAKERAVAVSDQKSQEEIKMRASNIADEVASFLYERKKDVMIATIIPATESAYKQFVNQNKKPLWVKENNNIKQVPELLYSEMALIDKQGNEVIKIVNGEVAPKSKLTNVSIPANTTYKNEEYFTRAKGLNKDDVYVSNVTGWYINKADFQKGKRFAGVIRFAAPVFGKEGYSGVVVLSLDVRHLASYSDHVVPTSATPVFKADVASGNYTYMVDNRGLMIAHPIDYHIAGLYPDGTPVPSLTEQTKDAMVKKGEEVLNLSLLGYMDPALPGVAKDAASGNAGMKMYKFGGHTKFVAYAPIKFYSSSTPKPAGFGWVGMGIDVDKFNELASAVTKKIQEESKAWITTITLIIIISVVLLFFILAILARGITRSIEAEVPAGAQEAGLKYDDEEDDK
jgi:hypothetical protein